MKRKRSIVFYFLMFIVGISAQTKLTIDINKKGIEVSPTHYGIFYEDINHAADGGLYAELIKNRSFEDASFVTDWGIIKTSNAIITTTVDHSDLLNSFQTSALKMVVTTASDKDRAGVYNAGFWGINVVKDQQYDLSFFSKCNLGFKGTITATLESITGEIYATKTISSLSSDWQRFNCALLPSVSDTNARLVLTVNSPGILWLDVVSLFPPTYKNRSNGLRIDLAQLIADMHPKFMRFPGGCFVEGDNLSNRFQWKKTIGNIETRPGHLNLWGYRSSDGMGYHEFLQMSEDFGAEPLYVFNIGVSHTNFVLYNDVDPYIQDALDAIEYANGAITTTYGALRAANGHPTPFNMKYVEIGNENAGNDHYADRFFQFKDAIKAKYPTIKCIADGEGRSTAIPSLSVANSADFIDEHYYSDPQWFTNQTSRYDTYNRKGPKIYVGEYAVTTDCGLGNLKAAIGEAAFMSGMEKNSDIVPMNSYAPLLVNVNDRKWTPDMINFDASSAYGTPSYYVQKMFANNIGNVIIPIKDSLNEINNHLISGAIGLCSWNTSVEYSNIAVKRSDNTILFSDQFSNSASWTSGRGNWTVSGGIYSQTSLKFDCRSMGGIITDSVYTYSLKARKIAGNEGFLIMFGNKDTNNFYWWNIGGWGNTLHGIEKCTNGSKTIMASVAGTVVINKWYDIRVEVYKDRVMCYLDNVLIHNLKTAIPSLFTTASYDTMTNQLFVKVVNTSTRLENTTVNLQGTSTDKINGTVSELTSANLTDENGILSPTKIIPVTNLITNYAPKFNYLFKPNSVTVLKLNVGCTSGLVSPTSSLDGLKVYPTITHDYIFTQNVKGQDYTISLTDSSGRVVFKRKATGIEKVNLSNKRPGVYFIQLKSGDKILVEKVIKR